MDHPNVNAFPEGVMRTEKGHVAELQARIRLSHGF